MNQLFIATSNATTLPEISRMEASPLIKAAPKDSSQELRPQNQTVTYEIYGVEIIISSVWTSALNMKEDSNNITP